MLSIVLAISDNQEIKECFKNEEFYLKVFFREESFMSAGQLVFPIGSMKSNRNSANHVIYFYVIKGSVDVTINKTEFVAGIGISFFVPRGNQYQIIAKGTTESVLNFCYCSDNTIH